MVRMMCFLEQWASWSNGPFDMYIFILSTHLSILEPGESIKKQLLGKLAAMLAS